MRQLTHSTANIEWCEENYATCKYIAEFYNTVTNALFIAFAIYGIHTAHRLRLEKRFALTFASYMLIGIGSWCFHMTLLYEMQLMDELPSSYDTDSLTKRQRQLLPLALTAIALAIAATYLLVNDSLYYQCCYGALTLTTIAKAARASKRLPIDSSTQQELRQLLHISCGSYGLGFIVWNIDNVCCAQLRAARASIGDPWSGLLQLHAWWHILAGLGGYGFIVFCQYLHLSRLDKQGDYVVEWSWRVVPTLVPRSVAKAKRL
ncbi:ceramidase [Syncephalis pseudoplumigaleata]|uniref:Ceramidase n=1 Tax=Syncephalis pseudoplumigaleata TaxID=1712513 RepID=A0A4P9YWL7_9FUNG|nr:ceramidase [Syncephalis pseudoplumigaleata]|eukprot:RKP23882.1 ceramidase [Syncephalis pseudoplumigaleata]